MVDQKVEQDERVADAPDQALVYRLMPLWTWPYFQLMRADRPIGTYLLFWPGAWSVALANLAHGAPSWPDLGLIAWFFVGALLMRGAGCVWNDITDRDLDAKVERTRSRPIPSKRVRVSQAAIFMMLLAAGGLLVLLQFNSFSILLGLASLPIVLIYPFMKRFTDYPQFVLGLAFNWGALLGWAAVFGSLSWPPVLLYVAGIFWTLGYDTIYAHQDKEDDALIGVRSTALVFGAKTKLYLSFFYASMFALVVVSLARFDVHPLGYFGLVLTVGHLAWQVWRLDIDNPDTCLTLFRANHATGALLFLSLVAGAL